MNDYPSASERTNELDELTLLKEQSKHQRREITRLKRALKKSKCQIHNLKTQKQKLLQKHNAQLQQSKKNTNQHFFK